VTQRYFVYPLAVLVIAQLGPLLRGDWRWFLAQVVQLALILLASLGAIVFEGDFIWVIIAWAMFVIFVLVPRVVVRLAWERQQPAWWKWAARFAWGQLGRLYRRYARAEELWQQQHRPEALTLMNVVLDEPLPESVRGEAQLFRLRLLSDAGDWAGALGVYETVEDWGTLFSAARARLVAARAYAQAGNFERAFRCLQMTAQSPRTLGQLDRQYRAVRDEVVGRATEVLPPEMVALARAGLRAAEQMSAEWRALMSWGRPAAITLALVLACAVTWLVDKAHFDGKLWMWAGNDPEAVREGEWWRPVSALFLHANWLHLTMNGAALWMFGSAVERTFGRWRFVVIFLLAGAAANTMSAWIGHYDVSVGASGGIFGLIAAFAVSVYQLRSPVLLAARRRLLLLLGLMLTADLTIGGLEPQVDNLAHAGGFVAGLALAVVLSAGRQGSPQRHQDTK
jgi:membrane associated rhomboid family serine protease